MTDSLRIVKGPGGLGRTTLHSVYDMATTAANAQNAVSAAWEENGAFPCQKRDPAKITGRK
jgi:hypothetical protein